VLRRTSIICAARLITAAPGLPSKIANATYDVVPSTPRSHDHRTGRLAPTHVAHNARITPIIPGRTALTRTSVEQRQRIDLPRHDRTSSDHNVRLASGYASVRDSAERLPAVACSSREGTVCHKSCNTATARHTSGTTEKRQFADTRGVVVSLSGTTRPDHSRSV
jgi:hypothetical protein